MLEVAEVGSWEGTPTHCRITCDVCRGHVGWEGLPAVGVASIVTPCTMRRRDGRSNRA